jgi:hypothetical protein
MNANQHGQLSQAPQRNEIVVPGDESNVLPYVLLCFTILVGVLAVALGINRAFEFRSPVFFGLIGILTSVCVAAAAFGWRHSRHFLARERIRFTIGCFAAHWVVDHLPGIVARRLEGQSVTISQVALELEATAVGLLLVWLVVRFVAPRLMPTSEARAAATSSNTSLERTRDR